MAGATHEVVNDGSIGVNSRGSFSGSDRSSEVPVVSLEVSDNVPYVLDFQTVRFLMLLDYNSANHGMSVV